MTYRTTSEIETHLRRLNLVISRIESRPHEEWPIWRQTILDLHADRDALEAMLAARRSQAALPVVSLDQWRTARTGE